MNAKLLTTTAIATALLVSGPRLSVADGTIALPTLTLAPATDAPPAPAEPGADPLRKAPSGGDSTYELPPAWNKNCPFSILVEYSLLSDYICRKGLNLSDFPGQGHNRLNQQLLVVPAFSTKDFFSKGTDFGTFSLPVWFEFYDGQPHLTPNSQCKLQEYDIMPSWTYSIPKTHLTLNLTYDDYKLPALRKQGGISNDAAGSKEIWVGLAFDDSCLFGQPILSPYFTYVQDIDNIKGAWLDLGVKHDFALGNLGLGSTPILRSVTLTTGIVVGVDHRYVDVIAGDTPGTHLSTVNYGLTVLLDLSKELKIPPQYGNFYVKGLLNYKEQVHQYDTTGFFPVLRDEFYGGVAVGWSW